MMRRLRLAAAIALACCGMTGTASAVPWSAADLREACADGDLYYLYGACTGYLAAVHDAQPVGSLCLPAGATLFVLEPAADAVGELDPIENENGASLALRALQAAFACD